jgi:hypothetical protein
MGKPITEYARSKAYVSLDCSNTGFVGSNPDWDIYIQLSAAILYK